MATQALVDEFRSLNADLSKLAQRDLAAFWAKLDTTDIAVAREQLTTFMTALVDTYGKPSALIAANYYDQLRAASPNAKGTFRAVMAEPAQAEAVAGTVRYAMGSVDKGTALGILSGATQRYVSKAGRDTIAFSSSRDPSPGAWARVPTGATTCGFCNMLASRGAVYGSEASAKYAKDGDRYHDDCNCVPTQIWTGDSLPSGYDPEALYGDDYKPARDAIEAEGGSLDGKTIAKVMDEGRPHTKAGA